MTIYRVKQRFLNKRYFVQSRYKLSPFWVKAFWQEFETEEEAIGLLQLFEAPSRINTNKIRSINLVENRIKALIRKTLIIEHSNKSHISNSSAILLLENEISRLFGLLGKLQSK